MIPFQYMPAFFLVSRPRVSQAFAQTVAGALSRLPLFVLQELARKGWRITLVWHVLGEFRELKYHKPRGWVPWATMNYLDGMCYSVNQQVVLAEKYINVHSNRWEDAARVDYVLFHEIGHALDASWGYLSRRKAFKKAWFRDVRALSRHDRRKQQYSIQYRSAAGRSEAFANAFTALLGVGADAAYFLKCFPHTAEYVRQTVLEPCRLVYCRPPLPETLIPRPTSQQAAFQPDGRMPDDPDGLLALVEEPEAGLTEVA